MMKPIQKVGHCGATVLSNTILCQAFKQEIRITPGQLQRILYFVHCEYGRTTGLSLLTECFEAWPSGPVVPGIYFYFKRSEDRIINSYVKDALNAQTGSGQALVEKDFPELICAIIRVLAATRNRTSGELRDISRLEGGPWWDAWQKHHRILDQDLILADATYRKALGL